MSDQENTALRDALSAAFDKVGDGDAEPAAREEAPETAPASPESSESTAAERARDQAGRFAKAEKEKRETLTLKGKPNAAKEQERAKPNDRGHNPSDAQVLAKGGKEAQAGGEANAQAAQQPAAGNGAVQSQPILPPQHWNGRDKVEWERLPHHVKETLSQEYQQVAELRNLNSVLEPFKDRFTQEFGGAGPALNSILSYWKFARTQPVDFLRDFIAQSRIDPQSLFGMAPETQQAGQPDVSDPVVASLQQELAAIRGQLQQVQQQPLIAQQNQIQTEVQSFGSAVGNDGRLAHPYFNDVKPVMAALMQSGQAGTLKEAYDMACYANPNVRTAMIAAREQGQAEERRRAAEQARNASASVTGAPGHRGPGAPSNETVRQTLERNLERLNGGRA